MPSLHVPEHLKSVLEASAARHGQTKEPLIEELLTAHVEEEFAAPETFTEAQIARFRNSIEQLERGERIGSEEVDAFFADWFRKLDNRCIAFSSPPTLRPI